MNELRLVVANLLIHISADEGSRHGLARFAQAWSSAPSGLGRDLDETTIEAWVEENELWVSCDGGEEGGIFEPQEAHLAIERALYSELRRMLPSGFRMLHAGAVIKQGKGFVFVGPSESGKSSLVLTALLRGYSYLSDDLLITDGTHILGVPRAVQFAPPNSQKALPLPPWLSRVDLDMHTYPRLTDDEDNSAPLWIPGKERTVWGTQVAPLHTIMLKRGSHNDYSPLASAEGLAGLLESSYPGGEHVDYGKFLKRCGALTWSDPHAALDELEALT